MKFLSGAEFLEAPQKAITLFGMSGLGKTAISSLLRAKNWFHYSADYRIGTRYMGEYISDDYKREAMSLPLFRALLRTDSISISANLSFNNLAPLSAYLGKPGDPKKLGLPFAEYLNRQRQHRRAEINAMLDVPRFINRAKMLYGYTDFVCDASGSLCEIVDPNDAADEVLSSLASAGVLIHIRADESYIDTLVSRFRKSPKPMYYDEAFLLRTWSEFKTKHSLDDADVDPDSFALWGFEQLMRNRLPKYQAIADKFGYTLRAEDVEGVRTADDFLHLVAGAIDAAQNRQNKENSL